MQLKKTLARLLVAAYLLNMPIAARAACPTPAADATSFPLAPNIILIVVDDVGIEDLPYFSPPIRYRSPDTPWWDPTQPGGHDIIRPRASTTPSYALYYSQRPDMNRLAARMLADVTRPSGAPGPVPTCITGDLGDFQPRGIETPSSGDPPRTPTPGAPTSSPVSNAAYQVAPWDAIRPVLISPTPTVTPGSLKYRTKGCTTGSHVWNSARPDEQALHGFGGLGWLRSRGAAVSRFYTTAAVCGPSRVSMLNGRHSLRRGNPGQYLIRWPYDETLISEYLKQGCGKLHATNSGGTWSTTNGGNGPKPQPCHSVDPDTQRIVAASCPCIVPPPAGAPSDSCVVKAASNSGSATLNAPCYATGIYGKWHLGGGFFDPESDSGPPWLQGYDEGVVYTNVGMPYWLKPGNTKDLYCFAGVASTDPPTGVSTPACMAGVSSSSASLCPTPQPPSATPTPPYSLSWACKNPDSAVAGRFMPPTLGTDAACNASTGLEDDGACHYSTRMYTRLALDFIDRHQGMPFFVTVQYAAVHATPMADAPTETNAHYKTAGTTGGHDNVIGKRWASIEEVDAAVGKILYKLASLPGRANDGHGTNAGGSTPANLLDQTIVLVTSDNGPISPGGKYGSPDLRPGKGTFHDGGIRMGLLASACGTSLGEVSPTQLTSAVDFFPTIAEAAGMPVAANLGTPRPKIVVTPSGVNCVSEPEKCTHYIDGKSMFGWLNGTGSAGPHRNFAFADAGGVSIVQRALGFDHADMDDALPPNTDRNGSWPPVLGSDTASGVCGYLSQDIAGRVIRGGSCQPCNSNADCVSNPTECVLTSYVDGGDRSPIADAVCKTDTCKCNVCLSANWKFAGRSVAKAQLYELTTNPQERKLPDCTSDADLAGLVSNLSDKLDAWQLCVEDREGQADSSNDAGACDLLQQDFTVSE